MSPDIEKRAIEAYDFLLKSLQDASVVIGEEGHKLLQEIATFGVLEHSILAVSSLVCLIVTTSVLIYVIKKMHDLAKYSFTMLDSSDKPVGIFPSLAGIALFVFMTLSFYHRVEIITTHSSQAIKAYVAPRVYTIEYMNDLINKNGGKK